MKSQARITTSIIFLLAALITNAQDTIYFNDATIVSAKINEVGISEIKCHRFDNLSGPTYIVLKKDINRIRYSNGRIDTITTFNSSPKEVSTINNGLQLIDTKIYYGGKHLGQLKTQQLLRNNSLSENQINLIKDVKRLELYDRNKKALAPGLFALGFVVPAITSLSAVGMAYAGDNGAATLFIAGVAAGVALRVSGHVVFSIYKNKSKAKKLEILKKYTQGEIIY
ncbi:MAG: hypothetical protein K0S26_1337 [Bacteroidota bacterium]|jgi:hypothetical protein|nr:hypothetical protein [Bacteroidota bacterium]